MVAMGPVCSESVTLTRPGYSSDQILAAERYGETLLGRALAQVPESRKCGSIVL